jgi:hypothetical protein
MASPTILVVSPDKDFAQPLAEQVKKELSFDCRVAESHEAARAVGNIALVVAHAPEEGYGCPVLTVRQPVRLPQLIADIADALHAPDEGESLALGPYRLQLRAKQLVHKGAQAALTDKEVQLLQALAGAGEQGLSREQLLKTVWGIASALDTHTLETHIYRLRAKLRELSGDDSLIAATPGGYGVKL